MFTFDALQLAGIIVGAAIGGGIIGLFLTAFLVTGAKASREEERRPWPGRTER